MREQLKNLTENDYWVYGVTESDFDHAVSIVREMIEARNHQYESEAARIRGESSETGNDILDDVAYYRYTDNQYLWHFALWRLQGLIEAVITYQLVDKNTKKLYGLKSKLEALVNSGYQIEQNEIDELLLWANLRNAISHAPPEQFRPIPLCEDDIMEYQMFVKKLFVRWHSEKSVEKVV